MVRRVCPLFITSFIAPYILQVLFHLGEIHGCEFLWHGIFNYPYVANKFYKRIKYKAMLRWTVIFLIVAIIAAIFGFGGVASGAASIAKILFFIFVVLFLLSIIFGRSRTSDPV
jgi:uncharacterized membrane protein YtjA (UPF0391 family)